MIALRPASDRPLWGVAAEDGRHAVSDNAESAEFSEPAWPPHEEIRMASCTKWKKTAARRP